MYQSHQRRVSAAAVLVALAGSVLSGRAQAQSTTPFPAQFELSSLLPANGGNGINGFVLHGINVGDHSGFSVSSTGDINGDGFADLIIGAFRADPNGLFDAGESYVVFGGPAVGSGGVIELSTLNGSNGFTLRGINNYDRSGRSVSSAGDVNGDGFDDLIIGATHAAPNGVANAGESYVVFGGSTVGSGGAIELSTLNGTNGFVLNGINANDYSGRSVSSAGDVNGDGIDDIIIGAFRAGPNGVFSAGESYVVFGSPTVGSGGTFSLSTLNGTNGFALHGIGNFDLSGHSVSSAGDVNGDGFADIIIGAPSATPNGVANAGESYVVFGSPAVGSGGVIALSTLNGTKGFVLHGVNINDYSGTSVSSAGDVNGDGYADLVIGAELADPNGVYEAGESYVVFGGPTLGSGGAIELSSLNGTNGFVLNGINMIDWSGSAVSSAGDVNGDGIDDLIIGAPDATPNGVSYAGESYVVFGGPAVGSGGVIELSTLNGANGFVLSGINAIDWSGISVSSTGDVNGDGVADLIIGSERADPNGKSYAGESYVVFGRTNANVWVHPTGGNFDTPTNWFGGVVPTAGAVTINTPIGVTVTGPAGAVFLHSLTLGATLGRTTLDLQPLSLLSVTQPFTIPSSAVVSGSGLLIAEAGFFNNGLIRPSNLGLVATAGLNNTGIIELSTSSSASGFVRLEVFGQIINRGGSQILLRQGSTDIESATGILNDGTLNIAFATAGILGPVNNTITGLISISGASSALFTDTITNSSSIILTSDSSLVILGSIIGNGVKGPGGPGTAGSVYVEGGVIPGILGNPFGTAQFDGNLDLGLSSHTVIEIGGTTPGVNLDQIGAQSLGLGGTLQVVLANGYVPQPGDVYQVLDFVTTSGSFASVILDPGLLAAGANTTDLLVGGTIFVAAPCPADLNGDGFLDNGDISTFISLFLSGNLTADMNGDGFLDNGDISTFIALFLAGC